MTASPKAWRRRGGQEPVTIWNPEGFEPRDYLDSGLHEHADCARYFLHLIHYSTVFDRRYVGAFVPLKAEYLRKFFPSKSAYKRVRDCLLEKRAILCDNQYIEGSKSYGYKLGPSLVKRRQKRHPVSDRKLAKKILRNRGAAINAPLDVHQHLLGFLRNIHVDYPAALASLGEDALPSDYTSLEMLRDKELFFHVCKGGRCHTNLTNLRSSLRRYLKYRELPLVNLDIRNSQPLLLSLILVNYLLNDNGLESFNTFSVLDHDVISFFSAHSSGSYRSNDSQSQIVSLFSNSSPSTPPLPPTPLRCPKWTLVRESSERLQRRGLPEDAVIYVDLVQTGNFYEFLMKEGNVSLEKRQSFKKQFFGRVFYCKDKPQTDEAKLFEKLFPTVYGVVKALKGRDYTALSKLLQKYESSIIINRAVRRCMEEIPETFVATIHDSIVTTPGGVSAVKHILLEEFATAGLEPQIQEEHYGGGQARTEAA